MPLILAAINCDTKSVHLILIVRSLGETRDKGQIQNDIFRFKSHGLVWGVSLSMLVVN